MARRIALIAALGFLGAATALVAWSGPQGQNNCIARAGHLIEKSTIGRTDDGKLANARVSLCVSEDGRILD